MPELSAAGLRLFVECVALLQLLFLIELTPRAKWLFLSEKYGGYGDGRRITRIVQSPALVVIGMLAWAAACIGLIVDFLPLAAALLMAIIAQYVFVRQRWVSISRGCGAPGYVSYWLTIAVLALQVGRTISGNATGWFTLVLIADLALIFFVAGLYKFASGYRRGHGVVLGLVNPEWSYAPRFWGRIPAGSRFFRALDGYGWFGEVVGAVLLVIPWTRSVGAIIIALMFLALVPLVRLGLLTLMVLSQCLLVILASSDPIGLAIRGYLGASPEAQVAGSVAGSTWLAPSLALGYLALLTLAYAGMLMNFYSGWRPHVAVQAVVDRTVNALGLVLWRVFTSDVTNFYVEVFAQTNAGEVPLSKWSGFGFKRFQDVTEAICVTSIFTARKYYPGNQGIFEARLVRYAKSIRFPEGTSKLSFKYIVLNPWEPGSSQTLAATFEVSTRDWSTCEQILAELDPSIRPAEYSAVRPADAPGTYRRAG